jgi:hypothetical protein
LAQVPGRKGLRLEKTTTNNDSDGNNNNLYVGNRLEYSHHSSVGRKRQSRAVFPTTHATHDRWSQIKNEK